MEVIVVVIILGLFVLTLLMTLPRGRETARLASCQQNLMQIGVALVLYDQETKQLPTVAATIDDARRGSSPLKAVLETLGLPDFRGLSDPGERPSRAPGPPLGERRVPGFLCASDPNATAAPFPAPISYRANTGDTTEGRDGPFTPGRIIGLAEIEAGDGTGYTAAFAERLVGDGRPAPAPMNYARVPGPLADGGCPRVADQWSGDAGASWVACGWRSTLYNHAMTPGASPSCLADDGRSAYMGASSGHLRGVNVLLCDGSVKVYTPTVEPNIWRALSTSGTPEPPLPTPR